LTICGFFYHAKTLLDKEDGPKYVPFGHAHQSGVENSFSQLRSCGRDSAATVAKGLLQQTVKMSVTVDTTAMKKGGVYDEKILQATEKQNRSTNIFNRRDAQRNNKLSEWMKGRQEVNGLDDDDEKNTIGLISKPSPTSKEGETAAFLAGSKNKRHFSEILSADEDFQGIAKISIFGETEAFFETLFKLSNVEEDQNFDLFCQLVHWQFALSMDGMVETGARTKKGMHRRVLEFLQSGRFTYLVDNVSTLALRNRLGMGAVVLTLSRLFLDRMRDRLMSRLHDTNSNAVAKPESVTAMKLQVNRFVGYGLYKLIDRVSTQAKRKAGGDGEAGLSLDDEDGLSLELKFAKSLRIFDAEALTIPGYLSDCYDKTQALINNGYLTLLAPQIFDFGTQVMTAVAECITVDAFLKHGNECLCEGKKALEERLPTLQLVFNTCTSNSDFKVPEPRKEEMVKFIVGRTANAFYGKELKSFRELHTGRKGTDHTANAFRPHLKSKCLVGVVTDKQALAMAEEKKKRKR
jgi:hypothetical protein